MNTDVLSLFGTLFFALHSLYLLVATMKGIFKAGLRFPLLFRIYPVRSVPFRPTIVLIDMLPPSYRWNLPTR